MKIIRFSPISGGFRADPKCLGPERRHCKKIQSNKYGAFNITCKGFYLMQGELMIHFPLYAGDQRFTAI